MYQRKNHAAADLDELEKRGATFVRRPSDSGDPSSALPRHPPSSSPSTACETASYHSRLTGQGFFGISAYGLILIATFVGLAVLCYLVIHLLAYLGSNYL